MAGGWFLADSQHSRPLPPERPRQLIGFTLTDRTGRTVTRSELDGQFVVVSFVFSGCSSTCLVVNRRMAEIQKSVANQSDVRLVSLTVDPRTDTPPVLKRFAGQFRADINRWFFLTGDKQTLYSLIETSFLPQDGIGGYDPMPGGFTGTERIALVDPRGRVRTYFDGLNADTPAAVVAEITRLKARSKL
jgi:cytochrome oxidase Cu insertion factor (SCO1/SenC/PrrC family)